MAISHLNERQLALMSHINGIAKANIAQVNGITVGVPAPTLTGLPIWAYWEVGSYSQANSSTITTQWPDLSGNGRHLVPTAPASGITYRTADGPNGGPCLRTDGTSNAYFAAPSMAARTAGSFYEIVKVRNTTTRAGHRIGSHGFASHYPYDVDQSIYETYGSSSSRRGPIVPHVLTSWHLYHGVSETNKWSVGQNGNTLYSDVSNTVGFHGSPLYYMNGTQRGEFDFVGRWEFTRELTAPEITQFLSYIAYWFGLDHVARNTRTPVLCCGMECGIVNNANGHFISGGTYTLGVSTGTVRTGNRSIQLTFANQSGSIAPNVVATNTTVLRFYVRFATLPNANTMMFWVNDTAGFYYGIGYKASDGKFYNASKVISTHTFNGTGVTLSTNTWYEIELRVTFGSSRVVDSKIGGTTLAQFTSAGSSNASGYPRLGSNDAVTADLFIDDLVYSQTSADYPWGSGHVDLFVPVADGAHNTGTAGNFKEGAAGSNITDATTTSFGLIDEVPLDDPTPDTNDYINMATDAGALLNYVEHVLGPAPGFSTPVTPPRAVDLIMAYHQASTAVGSFAFKTYDKGEDLAFSFSGAGQTTTRYFRKQLKNAPSGGGWQIGGNFGNFNNFRTRCGYYSDGNPDQNLDGVMVEAEFAS